MVISWKHKSQNLLDSIPSTINRYTYSKSSFPPQCTALCAGDQFTFTSQQWPVKGGRGSNLPWQEQFVIGLAHSCSCKAILKFRWAFACLDCVLQLCTDYAPCHRQHPGPCQCQPWAYHCLSVRHSIDQNYIRLFIGMLASHDLSQLYKLFSRPCGMEGTLSSLHN